jgi:hypothetical protein
MPSTSYGVADLLRIIERVQAKRAAIYIGNTTLSAG